MFDFGLGNIQICIFFARVSLFVFFGRISEEFWRISSLPEAEWNCPSLPWQPWIALATCLNIPQSTEAASTCLTSQEDKDTQLLAEQDLISKETNQPNIWLTILKQPTEQPKQPAYNIWSWHLAQESGGRGHATAIRPRVKPINKTFNQPIQGNQATKQASKSKQPTNLAWGKLRTTSSSRKRYSNQWAINMCQIK